MAGLSGTGVVGVTMVICGGGFALSVRNLVTLNEAMRNDLSTLGFQRVRQRCIYAGVAVCAIGVVLTGVAIFEVF
ncbi:MAG TPA: hypothetical protein VKS60_14165 [Stellaceae bacterium]|nr:hypothetical protein [Stellaceae bacterium]